MRPAHRWGLAAVTTALIMLVPYAGHLRPTPSDPAISTGDLVAAVRDSSATAYSGTVEVQGSLGLPIADRFTDLADLFGGETRLRVWWRDSGDWRVDRLLETGEVDLFHQGPQTVEWSYERGEARASHRPGDPAPPRRRPAATRGRAAGTRRGPTRRTCTGCRRDGSPASTPPGSGSTSRDDRSTPAAGRPMGRSGDPASSLAADVYGDGADRPALTSTFTTFSATPPGRRRDPLPSSPERRGEPGACPRHRRRRQPVRAGGSARDRWRACHGPRADAALSTAAGLTRLLVVPLPPHEADELAYRLEESGAPRVHGQRLLRVGPLGVMVTGGSGPYGAHWLVTGTADRRRARWTRPPTWARGRGRSDPDPGADQALRPRRRGRRPRPRRSRRATSTASSARTARARPPPSGCCSAWCWRPPARSSCSGSEMPKNAGEVLPEVGALVEGPAAYAGMSGRANLALLDAMGPGRAPVPIERGRIDDALDRVGLGGVDSRPVRAYSLGMRQRLGLAATLIRRPRLLVLDEPTNGLDPQGIREIRDLLAELNREGTTVFLSSHLLAEVEQLCDRVGVLDRGRLVVQDRLDALRGPTGRLRVRTPDVEAARALLDGQVELADAHELYVRHPDAADPEPAAGRGWGAGRAARPRAPHAGGRRARGDRRRRRPGAAMIAVELAKLVRSRRTWVTIAVIDALPTLVGVLLVLDRRGAAARHRPGVPLGGAERRHPLPARRRSR